MNTRPLLFALTFLLNMNSFADNKGTDQETKTNRPVPSKNESKGKKATPQASGNYGKCNEWLHKLYPNDKMIQIDPDGNINSDKNSIGNFFEKSADGKIIKATFKAVNKKNRDLSVSLHYDVTKKDDGSMVISRRKSSEYFIQSNNGYGNQNYNTGNFNTTPFGAQKGNTFNSTYITMKKGNNGKCYVSEINDSPQSAYGNMPFNPKTEKCNKILNFHKKYPKIANCTDDKMFKELNGILGTLTPYKQNPYNTQGPNVKGWEVSVANQIQQGLSIPTLLLNKSIEEAKLCDNYKLAPFVTDDSLFLNGGSKQGPAPASKKVQIEAR